MRYHEIIARRLDEDIFSIDAVIDAAEASLDGSQAEDALWRFVGVSRHARTSGEWGGVMIARPLEDAFSSNPSPRGLRIRQEMEAAFAPVREALRRSAGDHVTLYRAQQPVNDATYANGTSDRGMRNVLSWTSDSKVAAHLAGVRKKVPKILTDQEIENLLATYERTGRVSFGGHTFVRSEEYPGYYDILDRSGDHITDGDDLRAELENARFEARTVADENRKRMQAVVTASVPVDAIAWITDRAGQKEFIVRNIPGTPWFIDETGKTTVQESAQPSRPKVFYRGQNPGDTRRIRTGDGRWDGYLFVSSSFDGARCYGSEVTAYRAKPNAKIVYEGTAVFRSLAKGLRGLNLLQWASSITKRATEAGYDAVWFKMQGDIGTAVINPSAFERIGVVEEPLAES